MIFLWVIVKFIFSPSFPHLFIFNNECVFSEEKRDCKGKWLCSYRTMLVALASNLNIFYSSFKISIPPKILKICRSVKWLTLVLGKKNGLEKEDRATEIRGFLEAQEPKNKK